MVPYGTKTLYFKPVSLQYLTGVKRDVFGKSTRIVADVLSTPAFSSLKSAVEQGMQKILSSLWGGLLPNSGSAPILFIVVF